MSRCLPVAETAPAVYRLLDDLAAERRMRRVPHSKWKAVQRAFGRMGWHYTTAGRCAARLRALTGCTLRDAGAVFGITEQTVFCAEKEMR